MQTIELFCGTKSFSKVAKELGHEIFTIDIEPIFNPDLLKDINLLERKELPNRIDILWASPPCQAFSVATIGRNWDKKTREPKTEKARQGILNIEKTIELIKEINPKYWFIENPRGMLRTLGCVKDFNRKTISYCQYGDTRMKPTDIWTNFEEWKPKPICHNGDSCHISAPRGSRTGTQGIKGATARGMIPKGLFEEIFKQIDGADKE